MRNPQQTPTTGLSRRYVLWFLLPALIAGLYLTVALVPTGGWVGHAAPVGYEDDAPRNGEVLGLSVYRERLVPSGPLSAARRSIGGSSSSYNESYLSAAQFWGLDIDASPTVKGNSGGSAYAAALLAMYVDHVDPKLLDGRVVAITGAANLGVGNLPGVPGDILPVDGVVEKLEAAIAAGADVLVVARGSIASQKFLDTHPDFAGEIIAAEHIYGVINALAGETVLDDGNQFHTRWLSFSR